MTHIRRLALKISDAVVRHASPGCKEWAEGLEREVDFIVSDLRALGWALGSLRVLFRNPPMPLSNAEEIGRAGRLFAGSREHVPPMFFLFMALQVFDTVVLDLVFRWGRLGHLQRTGFAIAGLSAAYMAAVGWLDFRMGQRPEDMDDGAWIEFYRGEMVRLRGLYTGMGALLPAALVLFCAGSLLGSEGVERPYFESSLIVLSGLIGWLLSRLGERFQRKVDDVNSVLLQVGREG